MLSVKYCSGLGSTNGLISSTGSSSSSSVPPKADQLTPSYSFHEYKAHFGKYYADPKEDAARAAIFTRNLAKILKHNKAGKKSSYKMGVNQFTDMEPREVPKGNTLTANLQLLRELRSQPHVSQHTLTGAPIPDHVDWREHQPTVVTPVKNQGYCGDCWAHATVETVESHWAIKHKRLWTVSQQQVTDCTQDPRHCGGTGGCEGALYELG